MGHHCDHHHGSNTDLKWLIIAFVVTAVFMVVEVIGGLISGSLALLADAAHMSTDAFALGLAASAHWISRRPADGSHHFGYRRIQVLAAFVNGILLLILISWILFEALQRYLNPQPVQWSTMLIVAVLGLLSNTVVFAMLTFGDRDNVNMRGAILHVLGDILGSVAAIVAAIVIMLTKWYPVDPLLSVFVALLIGRSAWRLVRETGHILLEGAPSNIDTSALEEELRTAAPEIADIHKIQIWQITPEQPRMMMHVVVSHAEAAAGTLARIKAHLDQHYHSLQSTIQIEPLNHCSDLIYATAISNEVGKTAKTAKTGSDKSKPESDSDVGEAGGHTLPGTTIH